MHKTSLLCSSHSISQSPFLFFNRNCFLSSFRCQIPSSVSTTPRVELPLNLIHRNKHASFRLHSTATEEMFETSKVDLGYVEVGYLSSVHGLQGEICVRPSTDFPELRFCEPGRRWLRQQVLGEQRTQEVELVEGRVHPGRKSWILKFEGIDTVDQAKLLVGSTLLAIEDARPELEAGEFYTRDLVGMRVILKETGEAVGSVVNVFDSGGNDLLHVMLESSVDMANGEVREMQTKTGESSPLIWVPFVEAIVPDVDLKKREMHITPPSGLLELNLRSDERSKKERRQIEWKEKKKLQKQLIAAKKKLCELEQQHVFHGFKFGEKFQGSLLAEQIVSVNSKLLKQALQNIEMSTKRWDVTEQISVTRTKLQRSTLKISKDSLTACASEDTLGRNFGLQQRGLQLLSKGKLAIISLITNDSEELYEGYETDLADPERKANSSCSLQKFLGNDQKFIKIEDRTSVPLVLVCPTPALQSMQNLFVDNDHYAFDSEKVWFFEEEKLPVVSSSPDEKNNNHKILMKSPWEILQSPVGSGGIISLLSSNGILDNLTTMGVEYIQICRANARYVAADNSLLLGFVDSRKAEIGIQIAEDEENIEDNFNIIFSMKFMKKLIKQLEKLQFYAVRKHNSHVEMVDKEWVDVVPSSPNSDELCSSIYSCINVSSIDKICLVEITE